MLFAIAEPLPVLKMEWVEGDTLGSYVEKNIDNPQALRNLAGNFLEIAGDLRRHNIAHGDLQHGNVMVVENSLRLVDYDGMFVPGLEKKEATEIGHYNYQHPVRDKQFGSFLDNFSVWVIYLSLVALSADTTLWNKLKLDEDCLVFRKNDFSSPETSEALRALDRSPDQSVRELAMSFRSLIYTQDLTKLPSLVDNPLVQISPLTAHPTISGWLTDHISPEATNIAKKSVVEETGASWVLDHLQPNTPITYKSPLILERLVVILYAISVVIILVGGGAILWLRQNTDPWLLFSIITGTGLLLTMGFASAGLFLIVRYHMQPEVKEKKYRIMEFKNLKEQINRLAGPKGLKQLTDEKSQLDIQEGKVVSAVLAKQQENGLKEKSEISKVETDLRTASSRLRTRQAETQEAERYEITKILLDYQNDYLKRNLEQNTIIDAVISGIGTKLKQRLLVAGIHTAADIQSYIDVPGVGNQKSNALLAWRQNLERNLRTQMPQKLPIHQEESLKAKYRIQMSEIKAEEVKILQNADQVKKIIRTKYGQENLSLFKSIQDVKNQHASRKHEIDQKINDIKQQLSKKRWALSKTKSILAAHHHIEFKTYLRRVLTRF